MKKDFWNSRYDRPEYAYGEKPNDFWAQWLMDKKPAKVLLPAEGEGRNAVYAAQKGWQVWAFDQSEAAQRKAHMLANQAGVALQEFKVAEAQTYHPPITPQVIGLFYVHLPPDFRADFHASCVQWLAPGGYLVLEAFNPNQLNMASGGLKVPAMLMKAAELKEEFKGLIIEEAQELTVELDEGPYHQGNAAVVRVVARKPD